MTKGLGASLTNDGKRARLIDLKRQHLDRSRMHSVNAAAREGLMLATIKARNRELSEKADDERRRVRDWLLPFMRDNQPKFLTKEELRAAAIRELNVSKSSFDFAWIEAI